MVWTLKAQFHLNKGHGPVSSTDKRFWRSLHQSQLLSRDEGGSSSAKVQRGWPKDPKHILELLHGTSSEAEQEMVPWSLVEGIGWVVAVSRWEVVVGDQQFSGCSMESVSVSPNYLVL